MNILLKLYCAFMTIIVIVMMPVAVAFYLIGLPVSMIQAIVGIDRKDAMLFTFRYWDGIAEMFRQIWNEENYQ